MSMLSERFSHAMGRGRMCVGALLAPAVCALVFSAPALAAPADLDPNFGSGGHVTTPGGSGQAIALQGDGKIVAVGGADGGGLLLARYNADGSLDKSFGTGGVVTTSISGGFANGVALDPNGDIVVVGDAYLAPSGTNPGGNQVAIERYLTDGTPDKSFNSGSPLLLPIGDGGNAVGWAVTTSGNDIFVAGSATDSSINGTGFLLLRLDQSGSVKTQQLTAIGNGGDARAFAIALTPDGRVVVAGGANNNNDEQFAVARYTSTGGQDFTFGNKGTAMYPLVPGTHTDEAGAVLVQADGRIVVGGSLVVGSASTGPSEEAMLRFKTDGSPDISFNASGKPSGSQPGVMIQQLGSSAGIGGLATDSYGHLIAAGNGTDSGHQRFAATVLTADGDPVGDFNPSSSPATNIVETDIGDYSQAIGVAVQGDGRIILGGSATIAKAGQIALARLAGYPPAAPPPPPPTTSTTTTTPPPPPPPPPTTTTTTSPAPFIATITAPSGTVTAGDLTTLFAHADPGLGQSVVSYEWALRSPSHYDVATSAPELQQRFRPGQHTVWMTAVSSGGRTSTVTSVTINAAHVGSSNCSTDGIFGWVELMTGTSCIQLTHGLHGAPDAHSAAFGGNGTRAPSSTSLPPHYKVVVPSSGIQMNGMQVECVIPGCEIDIYPVGRQDRPDGAPDGTHGFEMFSNTAVRLRLLNSPSGPVTLAPQPIDFVWSPPAAGTTRVPFDTFQVLSGNSLARLPLIGGATLMLTPPGADGSPGVALTFNIDINFLGSHISAPVTLTGDSQGDVQTAPDGWSIPLAGFNIPPLFYVNDGTVTFRPGTGGGFGFELQADVVLLLLGNTVGGDVAFHIDADGTFHLDRFSLSYDAGNGTNVHNTEHVQRPPVDSQGHRLLQYAGIDHLDAGFQTDPYFQVGGHLTFDLGRYKIGGGFSYTAPHDAQGLQLMLDGRLPIVWFNADITVLVTGPPTWGFGLSGTLSADYDPFFTIEGGIYADFVFTPDFDMEFGGHFSVTALGINLASVHAFVNLQTMAGCGNIGPFGVWGYYQFGTQHGDAGFGGCDHVAPYSIAPALAGLSSVHRGHAVAATVSHVVTVPQGIDWANIAATATSGAPRMHVSGPGVDYTTSGTDGFVQVGNVGVITSSKAHETLIGVHDPRSGSYTVTPVAAAGASADGTHGAADDVQVMQSLSKATVVTARVLGRGGNRKLAYKISGPAGTKVLFEERAGNSTAEIGSASNGRGVLRFAPTAFGARQRTIVAVTQLGALPRGSLVVARYTAPPLGHPDRPRGLAIRYDRRHGLATVSWRPVFAATSYILTVRTLDGRNETLTLRKTQFVVAPVSPGDPIRITVSARNPVMLVGPAARASLMVPRSKKPKRVRLRGH